MPGLRVIPSSVANATSGPSGLRGAPCGDSQYKPFCWPVSLMNFCAYCLTPPCFWEKYWAWDSASATVTSIAASSSRPMRRARISSFPSAASKYHWPAEFFISGIGNGWFSAPTSSNSLPSPSFRHRFITWYAFANPSRDVLSSAVSPVEMISADPGPKIAIIASRFCDFAASARALPASSGEAKALGAACVSGACSFLWQAVRQANRTKLSVSSNEEEGNLVRLPAKSSIATSDGCVFMLLPPLGSSPVSYRRPPKPPPPPRNPPPPHPPPPPRLPQPCALDEREPQPPPPESPEWLPQPLNAELPLCESDPQPPLLSPQPCAASELEPALCQPLPVFL